MVLAPLDLDRNDRQPAEGLPADRNAAAAPEYRPSILFYKPGIMAPEAIDSVARIPSWAWAAVGRGRSWHCLRLYFSMNGIPPRQRTAYAAELTAALAALGPGARAIWLPTHLDEAQLLGCDPATVLRNRRKLYAMGEVIRIPTKVLRPNGTETDRPGRVIIVHKSAVSGTGSGAKWIELPAAADYPQTITGWRLACMRRLATSLGAADADRMQRDGASAPIRRSIRELAALEGCDRSTFGRSYRHLRTLGRVSDDGRRGDARRWRVHGRQLSRAQLDALDRREADLRAGAEVELPPVRVVARQQALAAGAAPVAAEVAALAAQVHYLTGLRKRDADLAAAARAKPTGRPFELSADTAVEVERAIDRLYAADCIEQLVALRDARPEQLHAYAAELRRTIDGIPNSDLRDLARVVNRRAGDSVGWN